VKKRRPIPSPPPRTGGHLLDKFSQTGLRTWKKFSDDEEKYTLLLFYHLEGLREIHSKELLEALQSCVTHKKIEKFGFGLLISNTQMLVWKGLYFHQQKG